MGGWLVRRYEEGDVDIFFFGKMRFGMTCLGLSLEDDTRWSYYKVQCAVLENWTVLNYPTFIITLTAIYPTPSA